MSLSGFCFGLSWPLEFSWKRIISSNNIVVNGGEITRVSCHYLVVNFRCMDTKTQIFYSESLFNFNESINVTEHSKMHEINHFNFLSQADYSMDVPVILTFEHKLPNSCFVWPRLIIISYIWATIHFDLVTESEKTEYTLALTKTNREISLTKEGER